jgi:hypothetical protein
MSATLLNAPARPLLTVLTLSMAIGAAALPFVLRAVPGDAGPAAAHPQFARRMPSLPAIVVTAPDTADARR